MKEYYMVYQKKNGDIKIAIVEADSKPDAKSKFKKHWPEKKFIQFNKEE